MKGSIKLSLGIIVLGLIIIWNAIDIYHNSERITKLEQYKTSTEPIISGLNDEIIELRDITDEFRAQIKGLGEMAKENYNVIHDGEAEEAMKDSKGNLFKVGDVLLNSKYPTSKGLTCIEINGDTGTFIRNDGLLPNEPFKIVESSMLNSLWVFIGLEGE